MRVALRSIDKRLFHIVVNTTLLGRDEPGSHVHAVGTQGQRRHQPATIAESAGSHDRDIESIARQRNQD